MHPGLILYGSLAGGSNTLASALGEIDSRFVLVQQLKVGAGSTAGYRLVSLEELADSDDAGQLVHWDSDDDVLYGLERPSLLEQVADGLVPVVQLEQSAGIRALQSADLPVVWFVVGLWHSGEVSEHWLSQADVWPGCERLTGEDPHVRGLQALDPSLFDLTVNIADLSPRTVAALVAQTMALEPKSNASLEVVTRRARQLFGRPRFIGYLQHCGGSAAALEFYRWNTAISAAMWEVISYLEIALRNALAGRMADRHRRLRRRGSWLDDPLRELDSNSRDDIAKARGRVVRKSKPVSDGQTIAELGFGFWRYLLARRYSSNLWPDLAGAFPHAPNRSRETVELPVIRLHEFRNRLAHHERIWTAPIRELHAEMLRLLAYIDRDLSCWGAAQSRVTELLGSCPQPLPNP